MSKEYRAKNRDKIKEYQHNYSLTHKKEHNEYEKRWRLLNPKKAKEQDNRKNNKIIRRLFK